MSIKCGKCGQRHNAAAEVKICYNSGGDIDRQVTVTCGWGNNSHKWETTVLEAALNKSVCPEHRATKVQTIKVVDGPWKYDEMWVPGDSVQH